MAGEGPRDRGQPLCGVVASGRIAFSSLSTCSDSRSIFSPWRDITTVDKTKPMTMRVDCMFVFMSFRV